MPANSSLTQQAGDIQLNRPDEVQQVLGNPPGWMLRWGITLVFFFILLLLFLSWLIKYPDVISAPVKVTTENPVIRIVARADGMIEELFIENNEEVAAGTILALLKNPADWGDIQQLDQFLVHYTHPDSLSDWAHLATLNVGDLQGGYSSLKQKIEDYQYFITQSDLRVRLRNLRKRIRYITELKWVLVRQQRNLYEETGLAQKNFERNKLLRKEQLVSELDLENAHSNYLAYKRQLEDFQTQIINNDIQIEQLKAQIVDLEKAERDGIQDKELSMQREVNQLKGALEQWKQSYLLMSPITGKVSMSEVWSEQQFVNANQEVFSIVPEKASNQIIGRAALPIQGSGKVKLGQPVNVRLDGFPFQEYGILKTKVKSISLVPEQQNYQVEMDFSDSLVTTYGKYIPFKQEMEGSASIVTEERRILMRVFDKLYSLVKNR